MQTGGTKYNSLLVVLLYDIIIHKYYEGKGD